MNPELELVRRELERALYALGEHDKPTREALSALDRIEARLREAEERIAFLETEHELERKARHQRERERDRLKKALEAIKEYDSMPDVMGDPADWYEHVMDVIDIALAERSGT